MDKEVLEKILNLKKKKEPFCLVSKANSTDTKVITLSESSKSDLKQSINKALKEDKLILIENNNEEWIINPFNPPQKLIIVGAVHIAQYLTDFAKSLNFEISIIDPRGYFASEQRFPNMNVINKWPDEAFKDIETNENTALIALTHDPKIDDPALQHALNKKFYYIGALGSRKTHTNRCERLKKAGFSDEQINSIHGPIGIKLGGKSAPEIALSIIAQLVSETYKK